jgi:hypothetical protein
MLRQLATACYASALLLATAGFSSSDEMARKFKTEGDPQATTPATQPAIGNVNHEPGTALGVLPRDPKAERTSIDLTKHYTLALDEDASGAFGYTLSALPRGLQTLGNVKYDLRGIVQVSGQVFVGRKKIFPQAVKGIRVNIKCRALCFLHASRWDERDGKQIGTYVIHYSDGQTRQVPIIFGADVRDWLPGFDAHAAPANGPKIGWHGQDGKLDIVLFEKQWANPLPDVEIASIDMVSSMTEAAPFLVGLTAQ